MPTAAILGLMRVLSDASTAGLQQDITLNPQERSTVPSNYLLDYLPGFRLRLEELAARLDDPLLHGLLHEPPHGGGAAMSQAVDVAEYDGQAAIARLRGHVASALRYVRERERASSTSTGSTTGTVLADSP